MVQQATLEGFNSRRARVGMTGAVRHGALGTAPVPLGTKYDTEKHTNYGYLAPDGLEISFDEDKQEYIPWQEVTAIRTDITKAVKSIKFTLWESSAANIAKFLGVPEEDVLNTDGVTEFWEGQLPDFPREWLSLDVVDGDKALRLTLPDCQITGRGSMVFKKDEMFGLELTYSTYPAGAEDYADVPAAIGKTAHWQMNDSWASGGSTTSTVDGVQTLRVTTDTLPAGATTTAYSQKVAATGGTAPYTFTVASGTLPTGIALDGSTGELKGTATQKGTFTFTVKATDTKNLSATKQYNLTIA